MLRRVTVVAGVASAVFLGFAVTVPPRSLHTAHADVATSAVAAVPRVSQRHLVELFHTSSGHGIQLSERQQRYLSQLSGLTTEQVRFARLRADLRRADTVRLNLFDDVELIAMRQRLDLDGPTTSIWVGELVGGGYALLAVREQFLHGFVQTPTQAFRISPLGDGTCAVRQVVLTGANTEACGVRDVAPTLDARPVTPRVERANAQAQASARIDTDPVVAYIDVLVAYEESATQLTPDIVGHIETLVAWANLSYINSRVHLAIPGPCWPGVQCVLPQLRLAVTLPLRCDGCTDGVLSNLAVLERLLRFDEIHRVRNREEADVCVIMTTMDRPNSSGVAMAGPPDPKTAFCLIETPFSLEHPYILAHEVGHLQDAQHQTGSGMTMPYARGYCYNPADEPNDRFWTIMCTLSAFRVPFWSNPEIDYLTDSGKLVPMGDDNHNNARRVSETALIVASHRGPVIVPIEVSDFTAAASSGSVQMDWRLSATAVREITGVHVQRAERADGPYSQRTSAPLPPARVMSWEESDVTPGHTYYYRLRVQAVSGADEIVGPVQVTIDTWRTHLLATVGDDGEIRVRYSVGPSAAAIQLGLFDVRGRLVALLDQGTRDAGAYTLHWNRQTASGLRVGNGIYLLRLRAGRDVATIKLLLQGE